MMKQLMTIKRAKMIARALAKELGGVTRCEFEGLWPMELTATDKKTYIEMYDGSTGQTYTFKYSKTRDEQPCIPHHWRTKPRGAMRDEWQPIPDDFLSKYINTTKEI